ncbi:MAG: 50S ribosomal protein L21 [Armatimonadetes bacterium]|nr:50S ribosomal protein L21 [Armatimonadota bacterium]
MYAVVKSGGKQYTVREQDIVELEKIDVPAGEEVVLSDVLFISSENGNMIGTPVVEGARVVGKVLGHGLGKKIIGFTYKPKKNVRRRYGHRQPYTQVVIEKIALDTKKSKTTKTTEETSEK